MYIPKWILAVLAAIMLMFIGVQAAQPTATGVNVALGLQIVDRHHRPMRFPDGVVIVINRVNDYRPIPSKRIMIAGNPDIQGSMAVRTIVPAEDWQVPLIHRLLP